MEDTQHSISLVPIRLDSPDSSELAELEGKCFSSGWNIETFLEAFAGLPAFRAWGLRDGRLVAYVSIYQTSDCVEILNFGVLPERRREGLGRHLLGCVLRDAFKEGILNSVLDVRTQNAPAIALYEGLGFALAGRRKRYYTDTGEDALIYTLDSKTFHFEE